MKIAAAVSFALLLAMSPLQAQSVGERTGINSTLGISPSTPDFVKQAAISDMFEIQSSQLAAQKTSGAVKQFAEHMITDHTKTSTDLKGLVQGGKVQAQLPSDMDDAHKSKLAKLKNTAEKDFPAGYTDMQINAHKDAVDLFERYAKGGDNAELKAWAAKTLPNLQSHLKMAEELKK
jgi:putative membrane protein